MPGLLHRKLTLKRLRSLGASSQCRPARILSTRVLPSSTTPASPLDRIYVEAPVSVSDRSARTSLAEELIAESLRRSEDHFRSLVDSINDIVLTMDASGAFTGAYGGWLKRHKVPPETFVGRRPREIFDEVTGQLHEEAHARAMRGDTLVFEWTRTISSGRLLHVETVLSPKREGERIVGAVAVGRDITAQRRSESELFASKTMLQTVLDTIPQRVFWKDTEGRYLGCNRHFADDLGYADPNEPVGRRDEQLPWKQLSQLYVADDRAVMQTNCAKIGYEEPFIRGDGSTGWVVSNKVPLHDVDGHVIGVLGTYEDISARKAMEQELQVRTRELDRFFSVTLDLLCIADLDGWFRRLNPEWERTLGYTREELMQHRFLDLVHDEDREATLAIMRELAEEHTVTNFVNRYRCKDGSYRWIEWRSVPYGNLVYAAARDITDRKEQEARHQLLLTELRRSNSDLEQFAYVASHDLQEPLRMVSSYLQLLTRRLGDKLDDRTREYVNFAVDGAKRMQVLLTDLLAYSRVSTQGSPFVPTNLNEIVARARANLALALQDAQAVLAVEELPTVAVDGRQLAQLFQNLLGNAVKFRRQEAPQIRIHAQRERDGWRIGVTDNGIGIDAAYFERVFEIFQRLHSRESYPGTGIGLAICKKVVERHGGRIWIESKSGVGSTFWFTLPDRTESA